MNVTANITELNIDKIVVNSCAFGRLSAFTLKHELDIAFKVLTPLVNKKLEDQTITVPSNIGGIFELSDLYVEYYDQYLYGGATPTFIAPTTITA